MDDEFDHTLRRFRETESGDARGPAFAALVLAIEAKARATRVNRQMIVEWLGPPDLFNKRRFYLYRFDHKRAGRNRDEHYFIFDDEALRSSMFNRRGINDHAMLSPGSEFDPTDD